jgi:hypothetical protein
LLARSSLPKNQKQNQHFSLAALPKNLVVIAIEGDAIRTNLQSLLAKTSPIDLKQKTGWF